MTEHFKSSGAAGTALQEKLRVKYNPQTKQFGPMGVSETKKIDHMIQIENQIRKIAIMPTDYTSAIFLEKIQSKIACKGKLLRSSTAKVNSFFSGNASDYTAFLESLSKAVQTFSKPTAR